MQREESEIGGVASGRDDGSTARPPGLILAAGIAVLAGVGMWAALCHGMEPASNAAGNAVPFDIAQVDENEMTGALGSMARGNTDLSRLAARRDGCPPQLAWVSFVLAPHQPRTSIRVLSGRYASPVVPVTEVPQRLAIPYPAPYEAGRGTLILRKSGGAMTLALTPAWHVSASETEASQDVSWRPAAGCAHANGAP